MNKIEVTNEIKADFYTRMLDAAFAKVYIDALDEVLDRLSMLAWSAEPGYEATIAFGEREVTLTWRRP